MQFSKKHWVPGWPFCREILHGAQMSACYQYGHSEAFGIAIPPMLIWVFCVEFVRRCDFSGFASRRVNHFSKDNLNNLYLRIKIRFQKISVLFLCCCTIRVNTWTQLFHIGDSRSGGFFCSMLDCVYGISNAICNLVFFKGTKVQ